MKNSKLIKVLEKLTGQEFKAFGAFLSAAYFQSSAANRKHLLGLHQVLDQSHPDFDALQVKKETVYQQVFPKETFVSGRLEKLMSIFFKQLEEFIFIEWSRNSSAFNKRQSLLTFYADKQLDLLQSKIIDKQKSEEKKKKIKNNIDLYQTYLTESAITNLKTISDPRNSDLNLSNTIKSLDIYYLSTRLEYTCNLLAQENFHNALDGNDSYRVLDILAPLLYESKFSEVPQIKIYTVVYKILKDYNKDVARTLEDIQHLEKLLKKFSKKLPESQLRGLHTFNRSLLMRVLNLGKLEYTQAAFDIYKLHLKSGVIFNGKHLHPGNYKNIASIGIMLGKYDWVKSYLKKYKGMVFGNDSPEALYNFNLANCLFHQDMIEEAHSILPQHFEDLYYRLAGKRLEIKILYSLDEDLLDFKIRAFNQYIYRISSTLLPPEKSRSNKNFAKNLLRILAPANISVAKRNKIRERIEEMDAIKEKSWLLGILNKASGK